MSGNSNDGEMRADRRLRLSRVRNPRLRVVGRLEGRHIFQQAKEDS